MLNDKSKNSFDKIILHYYASLYNRKGVTVRVEICSIRCRLQIVILNFVKVKTFVISFFTIDLSANKSEMVHERCA